MVCTAMSAAAAGALVVALVAAAAVVVASSSSWSSAAGAGDGDGSGSGSGSGAGLAAVVFDAFFVALVALPCASPCAPDARASNTKAIIFVVKAPKLIFVTVDLSGNY